MVIQQCPTDADLLLLGYDNGFLLTWAISTQKVETRFNARALAGICFAAVSMLGKSEFDLLNLYFALLCAVILMYAIILLCALNCCMLCYCCML